jgi:hypothetical protein
VSLQVAVEALFENLFDNIICYTGLKVHGVMGRLHSETSNCSMLCLTAVDGGTLSQVVD